MTVTYNGSTLTTDTLYEDGTIEVKKGFNVEAPKLQISNGDVLLARKKNKISHFEIPAEINTISYSSGMIVLTKMKKKILTFTLPEENTNIPGISNGSVEVIRIKKVIITP